MLGPVLGMMAGMVLSFELDPPLTPELCDRIVDLWVRVTNAGGAVGFVPPVTADDASQFSLRSQLLILSFLQVDATAQANSGHPGAPMGMAPVAHVLFNKFMTFNPKNPDWVNRDRFVLSYVSISYIFTPIALYISMV